MRRGSAAMVCRRGVAAIEFAVIAPVILLILFAAYNIGSVVQQQIKLTELASTGGQYAMSYPIQAEIESFVEGEVQSTWASNPASVLVTPVTDAVAACDKCPLGQHFVIVLKRSIAPLQLPFFGAVLADTIDLSATYDAKIQ
jgi:hypothetical protein